MFGRTGRRAAVLLAAGALALSACGSGGDGGSSSSGGDAYEWGVNAELSGPLSAYGTTIATGVQAYVDQVNAAGGINGKKINLTQLDDAGDQSRAAANTTRLVTANKVVAIFGHSSAANCAAGQPVVDRYKVPQACLSVAKTSPYTFQLGPSNGRAVTAMLDAAKRVTGKSNPTAGLMTLTGSLTGKQLFEGIKARAESQGVKLVAAEGAGQTATDLSAQTAALVAAKAEVYLLSATGPGLVSVMQGLRAAGIKSPIVYTDGTGNMTQVFKTNDDGLYTFTVQQLVKPGATETGAKAYIDAVTPLLKGPADLVGLNTGSQEIAYAAARVFGEALKQCGADCSGEDLKAQLEKTSLPLEGVAPSFSYSAGDHYPYQNWLLYKVTGTEFTQVESFKADALQ